MLSLVPSVLLAARRDKQQAEERAVAAAAELALEKQQLHEEMTVVSAGRAVLGGKSTTETQQNLLHKRMSVIKAVPQGWRTHNSSYISGRQHFPSFMPNSACPSRLPWPCLNPAAEAQVCR